MKKIILLSSLLFSLAACGKKEFTQQRQNIKTYGETFDPSLSQDLSALTGLMTESDSVQITLKGTIEKTCAVKGCWMQLKDTEQNPIRVTFKDYGFFVPKTGAEGKTAIIQGYCIKQETSIEELQHYAQDAGESEDVIAAIVSPKMEYNFVASGVIIQD